jgi:hypothetical protein
MADWTVAAAGGGLGRVGVDGTGSEYRTGSGAGACGRTTIGAAGLDSTGDAFGGSIVTGMAGGLVGQVFQPAAGGGSVTVGGKGLWAAAEPAQHASTARLIPFQRVIGDAVVRRFLGDRDVMWVALLD